MTDKEFKRLSRSQLIDIIYQFQIKQDELETENRRLSKALADKRIRISQAGSIAEAALEMHNVMQSAQEAAAVYLEEIRIMRDETAEQCQSILEKARQEADAIIANANNGYTTYDSRLDAIMKEFGQNNQLAGEQNEG